jgi:ABC-2 type transport system ATP-binding protein
MVFSASNRNAIPTRDLSAAFPQLSFHNLSDRQVSVESKDAILVGPLVRFLEDQGVEVTEARLQLPSLEDVFVQITGIEAKVMRKEKEKAGRP